MAATTARNRLKRRALALAGALLAGTGSPGASAFFGFNPCYTPELWLIICCPKPCPTFDAKGVATQVLRSLGRRQGLAQYEAQSEQAAQMRQTLGAPGKRSRAVPVCGVDRTLAARADATEARASRELHNVGSRKAHLAYVQLRSHADAMQTMERIAIGIDATAERIERAAAALHNARDHRDLWRRIGELNLARRDMRHLAHTAELMRTRLVSAWDAGAEGAGEAVHHEGFWKAQ